MVRVWPFLAKQKCGEIQPIARRSRQPPVDISDVVVQRISSASNARRSSLTSYGFVRPEYEIGAQKRRGRGGEIVQPPR